MWCAAGPLAVVAVVFWTQCVLLDGVDAKKERKRPKEATPQHTETLNATLSNSEEVGGSIKVESQTFNNIFLSLSLWYHHLLNVQFPYDGSMHSKIKH